MKTLAVVWLGLVVTVTGVVGATKSASEDSGAAGRTAVLAIVQQFFDAMAAADGVALRKATLPTFQYHAVRSDANGTAVGRRTLDEFVARIADGPERVLERMWSPTVLVHERIAMVWTPYDFHRGGKFTHSGIDVFTLVRTDAGWKIADLAFTVEPNVPSCHPAGPPLAGKK